VDAANAADRELDPGMMKTGITRTVNGLLRVATVLASWREAIWIRVRCYKCSKLFFVHS
jgi:hypothetical protein